jgi:TonB-dependent SusC/RagA subfamily outer membrane receptor
MDWTATLLPMATAFGMALMHSLWIGALLYCLVRTVLPFLSGPGARHNVAYLALLGLGAGFVASLFLLYEPVVECSAEAVATTLLIVGPSTPAAATPMETFLANLQAYAPWLSAAYLLGLLPAALFLVRDQERSWVLRHQDTRSLPEAWRESFRRELDRYPALARVRCHLSERAGEVMTLGWWSPVIVFPVALVNDLTPEMARTILLHEIAHLRHYDHLLNYPQQLLKTLFFFHPAAHALCHLIDREREHRCDDWVAARCDDRRTYATALVTVARASLQPQNTLAMSATKTPFTSRIQRLFGGDHQKRDGQYALSVLLIVFLAAAQTGFAQLGANAGAADCPEEPARATTITDGTPAVVAPETVTEITLEEGSTEFPATTITAKSVGSPDGVPGGCDDCPPQPPASNDARAQEMYRRAMNRYAQSHANTEPPIVNGTASVAGTLDCSTTKISGTVTVRDEAIALLATPDIIARTDWPIGTPAIIGGQRAPGIGSVPVVIGRKTVEGTATVLPRVAIRGIRDTLPQPKKIKIDESSEAIIIGTRSDGEKTSVIKIKDGRIDSQQIAYFVDGKRKKGDKLDKLDPKDIESISVVKGKDKLQELNIDGAYEGAVMILTKKGVKKVAGEEKARAAVRIRTDDPQGKNPIYVIDGQLMESGEMSDLDPDNIAEVSVLKGPSATALYGEQGANGVVVIKTKKGAKKLRKKNNL